MISSSSFGALVIVLPLLGCSTDDAPDDVGPKCGDPATLAIDRGAALDGVDPGRVDGVHVEYAGAGSWRVQSTCNIEDHADGCAYEVIVRSDRGTFDPQPIELEATDILEAVPRDALRFLATTEADRDGFTFLAQPGDVVEIDALFGGGCKPELFRWVKDAVPQEGAPGNPLLLEPSAP